MRYCQMLWIGWHSPYPRGSHYRRIGYPFSSGTSCRSPSGNLTPAWTKATR